MQTEPATAVAIWHLDLALETETILRWAGTSLKKLIAINAQFPQAGVELIKRVERFRKQSKKVPVWSDIPPIFVTFSDEEIPRYNTRGRHIGIGDAAIAGNSVGADRVVVGVGLCIRRSYRRHPHGGC